MESFMFYKHKSLLRLRRVSGSVILSVHFIHLYMLR